MFCASSWCKDVTSSKTHRFITCGLVGLAKCRVTAPAPLTPVRSFDSPAEAASVLASADTCLGLRERTHAGCILSRPQNAPGSHPYVSPGLFLWSLGGCSGFCSPGNWNLENGKSRQGARLRGAHARQSAPQGEAAGLFPAFGLHLILLSFLLGAPSHLSRKLSALLYAGWSPFLLPAMKSPTWDMWSHLFLLKCLLPRHPHSQRGVQGLQGNPGPSLPSRLPSAPLAALVRPEPPPGLPASLERAHVPPPLSLWRRLATRHR